MREILKGAIAAYSEAIKISPGYHYAYSNILFSVNYHADYSSEEIYEYYKEYEQRFARDLYSEWKAHGNDRDPRRRLKIGYVSPSFWAHSTGYFLEPLLSHHDQYAV